MEGLTVHGPWYLYSAINIYQGLRDLSYCARRVQTDRSVYIWGYLRSTTQVERPSGSAALTAGVA